MRQRDFEFLERQDGRANGICGMEDEDMKVRELRQLYNEYKTFTGFYTGEATQVGLAAHFQMWFLLVSIPLSYFEAVRDYEE